MALIAVINVVCYTLAMPLGLAVLLTRNRRRLRQGKFAKAFGSL